MSDIPKRDFVPLTPADMADIDPDVLRDVSKRIDVDEGIYDDAAGMDNRDERDANRADEDGHV